MKIRQPLEAFKAPTVICMEKVRTDRSGIFGDDACTDII